MVLMLYNSSDCCEIDVGILLGPFWRRIQSPAIIFLWSVSRTATTKINRIEMLRLGFFIVLSTKNLPQIHADYVHTFVAAHLTDAVSFCRYLHDYEISTHLDQIIQHFAMHVSPNPWKERGRKIWKIHISWNTRFFENLCVIEQVF